MTANDFDRAFSGTSAASPGFTARLGRAGLDASVTPADGARDQREYRAYGFLPSGNFGEVCEVARWMDGTVIAEGWDLQYRFLVRVGYVGDEELRLFMTDCIVGIEGRNLRELRMALSRRQAHFIQQYSPLVWPKPPTAAETVIERVSIAVPERS